MAFKFLGFRNRAGVDVYIKTCLDCCFCVITVVTYSYIFRQYIKSQRSMPKARYILIHIFFIYTKIQDLAYCKRTRVILIANTVFNVLTHKRGSLIRQMTKIAIVTNHQLPNGINTFSAKNSSISRFTLSRQPGQVGIKTIRQRDNRLSLSSCVIICPPKDRRICIELRVLSTA